jgi:HAD superfamily hydrolase (TIGR01549 family)
MSRYKALLFDLCDTLVTLNFSKLPTVAVNGQAIRSTSGLIYAILQESYPQITFEKFYSVLIETTRQLHLIRDEGLMEVTSEHRFEKILERLGLHQTPETKGLLNRMISTHTDQIVQMMEFPESHRLFLKTCHERYRFGIVSNFDHAATVYRVLERQGVRDLFEEILISAEVGWRKPRREIFQAALDRMRLDPADTLFIGDRQEIDVVGAKQIGMAAAWLNPEDQPVRQDLPEPDHVIGSLGDLVDLP